MKTLSLLAAVIVMAACTTTVEKTTTTEVKSDPAAVRTSIENLEKTYAEGLNNRNVDQIMTYYADDAQSYHQGEQPMIGKAAIRSAIERELASMEPGMKIAFETKDVITSNDDQLVVETGRFTVSADTARVAGGDFLAVFQKRDGKYQCVRDMIVMDTPK